VKKTPLVVAAIAAAVLVTASAAGARPAAREKAVEITFWHAQTDTAQKTIHKLVGQFNATHPGIVVHDQLGSNGDEMVQKLQAIATEAGNVRLTHILHDIQSYHSSPIDAAKLANEAKVKLLVFYHFTPPIPNMVAEAMFTRGVHEVRQDGCLVSNDGTLIELPLGTEEIRTGSLAR